MPPRRRPDSDLVYSSDAGRLPRGRPPAPGRSPSHRPGPPMDGVVRVSRTSSGRGGKTVTLVHGIPPAELEVTAKELKRLCGTGGTAKDGVVEIQGDHRRLIADHLASRYPTKLAGG